MLKNGFEKYFVHNVKILNFVKCFPYELDPTSGCLKVTSSKSKLTWCLVVHAFELFYLFGVLSVLYNVAKHGCLGKTAEGGMITVVIMLLIFWSIGLKPNLMAASVVNSALKLEQKIFKRK
jgi:hypothetical protein